MAKILQRYNTYEAFTEQKKIEKNYTTYLRIACGKAGLVC
jgi:hypothetical protein